MAALLSAVTTDTVGTGASQSGPCMVYFSGSMGGGFVRIEVGSADANYRTLHVKTDQQPIQIPNTGAYYIRAVLKDSVSPSLTVTSV